MAMMFNCHGPQGSRRRGKEKPDKKKSSSGYINTVNILRGLCLLKEICYVCLALCALHIYLVKRFEILCTMKKIFWRRYKKFLYSSNFKLKWKFVSPLPAFYIFTQTETQYHPQCGSHMPARATFSNLKTNSIVWLEICTYTTGWHSGLPIRAVFLNQWTIMCCSFWVGYGVTCKIQN